MYKRQVLCYVPGIGKEINGERRWITIGMQFQPSECAKLCMMIALANWLALYRDRTTSFWWGLDVYKRQAAGASFPPRIPASRMPWTG